MVSQLLTNTLVNDFYMIYFIFKVEPGHRAFKFNAFYGVGNKIFREGWHMKIPGIERPVIYDVRTHPKVIRSSTGTKGEY